jgi:type II secretory pathway pseudopilin PulG
MSILIVCPHCGHQAEAADEYAGETGPCAGCGAEVTAPRSAAADDRKSNSSVATGVVIALVLAVLVALAVVIVVGVVVALPSVQRVRQTAQQEASAANLQLIAQALLAYQAQFGTFPPAYTVDNAGRPLHSWRVLILPFLGAEDVYHQIDLAQPWDAAANQYAAGQMPWVYAAPPGSTGQTTTDYLAVVGPRTLFTGSQGVPLKDVTDGPHVTIAVVETSGSGIHWMEPLDLDASQLDPTINGTVGNSISSSWGGGANVVTADGTPHFLPDETDAATVQALLTRDGNESVSLEEPEE